MATRECTSAIFEIPASFGHSFWQYGTGARLWKRLCEKRNGPKWYSVANIVRVFTPISSVGNELPTVSHKRVINHKNLFYQNASEYFTYTYIFVVVKYTENIFKIQRRYNRENTHKQWKLAASTYADCMIWLIIFQNKTPLRGVDAHVHMG